MNYIVITIVILGGAYAIYKMIKKNSRKKLGKTSAESFSFTEIDRKKIEDSIHLEERSEKDAQFGRPKAHAKEFSDCEAEGIDAVKDKVKESIKEAREYLAPVTNKIDEIKFKIKKQHFNIQNTRNKISEILEQAKTTFQNQRLVFDKEDRDVDTFRNLNGVGRQPAVLTFNLMIIQIGIIVGLFILESYLNMKLLAEAIGEEEGFAYSSAVAGLNVMVSALVGYFVLKGAVHFKQRASRFWLIFVMFLYGILITYINVCLGAVRAIYDNTDTQQNFADMDIGGEGAAEGLNPLYFWTVDWNFLSLVLTFVGITFAVISLIDAYLYNDTYPGYGSVAKNREKARAEINRISENLGNEVGKVFNSEHSKSGNILNSLQEKELKEWVNYSNHVTHVFDAYKDYIIEAERDIIHITEEYRRHNEEVRTDKVRPAYWDKKYELDIKLKTPEEIFSNSTDYYFPGDKIQEKVNTHQKRLTEEQIQYEKDLNILKDETDKKILELRKNYAFT